MNRIVFLGVLVAFLAVICVGTGYASPAPQTASERKMALKIGYGSLILGGWGIVSFAATGGAYQLVSSTIFVTFAMLCMSKSVEGVGDEKSVDARDSADSK